MPRAASPHGARFSLQKCGDADGGERLLSPSPRPPPTVSQQVFHFFIVAVGAEESSVKDGEIFNDLSELTRFEGKGKGGREGEREREARTRKTSSS